MTHRGRRAIVRKNDRHPEYYLWIELDDGRTFFFGVLENGMTRGRIRRDAITFLKKQFGP